MSGIVAGVLTFAALACSAGDSAQVAKRGDGIGQVDFQVSCEAAREKFDHALGLLHHMMYVQARGAFEEIAEANPDCATTGLAWSVGPMEW